MATDERNIIDEGNIALVVDKPAMASSPVVACGSTLNPTLTSAPPASEELASPKTEPNMAKSGLRPQAPEFLPDVHQTGTQQQETETESSSMAAVLAAPPATAATLSALTMIAIPKLADPITTPEEPKQQEEDGKACGHENSSEDGKIREMAASHDPISFSAITDSPPALTATIAPDMAHLGDVNTVRRSMTPATPPPIASPHINAPLSPIVKGEDNNMVESDLEAMKLQQIGKPMPIMNSSPETAALMYNPRSLLASNYGVLDEQNLQCPAPRHGLLRQEPTNTDMAGTNPYPFGSQTLLSSGDDPVSEGRRIYLGNLDYNVSRYEVKMLLRHHGVYRTVEKIYMPFQDPNNEREISSMEVSSLGGDGRFPSSSSYTLSHGGGGGGFGGPYPQFPSRRPSPYYDGELDGPLADTEGNVAMKNKGFVFVTYTRASEADDALSRLNGAIHFGRRLVCRPGLPKGVSFHVGGANGGGSGGLKQQQQLLQLLPWTASDGYNSNNNNNNNNSNSSVSNYNRDYEEENYSYNHDSSYYGGGRGLVGGSTFSSVANGYGGAGNDAGTTRIYGPSSRAYGGDERDEYSRSGSSSYYYGGYGTNSNSSSNRHGGDRLGGVGGGGYNAYGSGYGTNDGGYGRNHWQQQQQQQQQQQWGSIVDPRHSGGGASRPGWGAPQQNLGEHKAWQAPDARDPYAVASAPIVGGGGGGGGPITYGYTSYKFKALGVRPGLNAGASAGGVGGAYAGHDVRGAGAGYAESGVAKSHGTAPANDNNYHSYYYCGGSGGPVAMDRPRSALDSGYAEDPSCQVDEGRVQGYMSLAS